MSWKACSLFKINYKRNYLKNLWSELHLDANQKAPKKELHLIKYFHLKKYMLDIYLTKNTTKKTLLKPFFFREWFPFKSGPRRAEWTQRGRIHQTKQKTQTKKLNTLALSLSLVSALINTAAGGGAIVFAPERACNLYIQIIYLPVWWHAAHSSGVSTFSNFRHRAVARPGRVRRPRRAARARRHRHFSSDSASPRYHPFTPASTLTLYAYVWINRRVINQRR